MVRWTASPRQRSLGAASRFAACLIAGLMGCAAPQNPNGSPWTRLFTRSENAASESQARGALPARVPAADSAETEAAREALRQGWDGFLTGLDEARRGLEDPALYAPPASDRNLAEGYRYLLGHLARIIEAQTQHHPHFPYFQRSMRMLSKWTLENPDTMYLSSTIEGRGVYRVRGRGLSTRAWRTGERGSSEARAPRVVIFQTTTNVVGDTGELAEMANCRNQTLDSVDQFDLDPDGDGRFEILIAAERPPGYEGLFLRSQREMTCPRRDGQETPQRREATQLNVREIFSDWQHEIPLELEIVRMDKRGTPRPPRSAAEMSTHYAEIGRRLGNQIKFWNALHEVGLEVYGDRNGDGRLAFPTNALNPPAPPFIAGGTAGAGQLYAAGTIELAPDQALIVRVTAPEEPHYVGFQLSNLWGESPDQANFVSSATGEQNPVRSDGARYYVVSEQDPGVAGWIDTTGLSKSTAAMRFIFRENPPPERWPTVTTEVVPVRSVRAQLPDDVPSVSPADRLQQVDLRQRHIQRRWRQY